MSEEKLEILRDKFLKYHLEYKDEEMLFEIIDKLHQENAELKKQLKVNNTFNTKESEVRTPRYIESTTLKRWWLE